MTDSEIRNTLDVLHTALAEPRTLQPATRESARVVLQDLARLLIAADEAAEPKTPTSAGLRDMLIEFEADHPKLAQTLGRLADGLQNLGI